MNCALDLPVLQATSTFTQVLPGVGASVPGVVSLTELVVGSSGLSVGVVGAGVVSAGVVGAGVDGAAVVSAGVVGAGVDGAGVVGAGVVGDDVVAGSFVGNPVQEIKVTQLNNFKLLTQRISLLNIAHSFSSKMQAIHITSHEKPV